MAMAEQHTRKPFRPNAFSCVTNTIVYCE